MKIRSTHCVEVTLTPRELAKALGHPEAQVRKAELSLKEGELQAIQVHLEYVIATKGLPKTVRRFEALRGEFEEGHGA